MILENFSTFSERFILSLLSFNGLVISVSVLFFIFSYKVALYLDTSDIETKNLSKEQEARIKKKEKILHTINLLIIIPYLVTFYIDIPFLHNFIKSFFTILFIYTFNLWAHRKILLIYGKELEIGGESYFKKGYQANIFSLITSIISFILGVFLCLKILGFDSIFEVGGVWAGILAFMGFTATVWATDMVAGIIILHNRSIEVGHVISIKELGVTAWVKSIALAEVKLIDMVHNHSIIIRPSKLRDLTIENYSLGLNGSKSTKIHRSIDIKVGYDYSLEDVAKVCYEAFDEMIANLHADVERRYFPEDPIRSIEIGSFGDFATIYKFSYYITSPFYIVKGERILNAYLQKYQKKYNVYFSTPEIIQIKKEAD